MPKTLAFQFSANDLAAIQQASKHDKRPEVRQRAIGLRMLHEGKSPKAVADFLAISQPTANDRYHRWQVQGVEGFVCSIFQLMRSNLPVPDHSTLSRRGKELKVNLPKKNNQKLNIVMDSTGSECVNSFGPLVLKFTLYESSATDGTG